MDNCVNWHTDDRCALSSDYADLIDGVDEFIFEPLTSPTPGNFGTDPTHDGGAPTPTPTRRDDAA